MELSKKQKIAIGVVVGIFILFITFLYIKSGIVKDNDEGWRWKWWTLEWWKNWKSLEDDEDEDEEEEEEEEEEEFVIPKDYFCGGTEENSNTCPTGKICKIKNSPGEINSCIVDEEYEKEQSLKNNPCLAFYGTQLLKGKASEQAGLTNLDSDTRYSACIANTSCSIYTQNVTQCAGGNDNWWRCDSATPVNGKTQIDVSGRDMDLFHCTTEMLNSDGVCDCTAPGPTGYSGPTCAPQFLDDETHIRQGENSRYVVEGIDPSDLNDYVRLQSTCSQHLSQADCEGIGTDNEPYRGIRVAAPNTCAWYPN